MQQLTEKEQRHDAILDEKIAKLKEEGFDVEKFTPYHVRINGVLDCYITRYGGSVKCKRVGAKKFHNKDSLLIAVHNYFKFNTSSSII